MRRLAEWNRFDGLVDGTLPEEYINKFVTGETCLIAVGKPVLSMNTDLGDLVLLGSGQEIQVQQQKQEKFVWEMGSRRGVLVPGRAVGSLSLSKMQLHGPSLLKALYGYLGEDELLALKDKPGPVNGDFWLNLCSEVFDRPTGIGLMMRDMENSQFSSFFFENLYIGGHQFATGAQTIVIGESVQTRFEAIIPLPMADLR
jgi:hypothetical protein